MLLSFEEFLRRCADISAVIVLEPIRCDTRIGFLALAMKQNGDALENLNLTCEVVGSEINSVAEGLKKSSSGLVH